MEWDSRMESGIPVIDYEHKQLVLQVASLLENPEPERVEETFEFLRQYVVKHFAHEQLMHKGCAFPDAAEHKEAHKEFVAMFIALEEEYREKGHCPETLGRIADVCGVWLQDHIMGMDMAFARFYKALDPDDRPSETSYHSRPTEWRFR